MMAKILVSGFIGQFLQNDDVRTPDGVVAGNTS
jgi:hypothetical protein